MAFKPFPGLFHPHSFTKTLILGNDGLDDHDRLISLLDIVEDIATGWSPRLTYEDKCAKRLVTRDLINIGRSMLQLRDFRYKERIKKILEIAVRKDDEVLFVMLLPLAEFARELIGADVLRARLLSAQSNVGVYAMLLYYQGYGLPEDFPAMRKFAASTKFKVGLWTEDIINTIQKRVSQTPLDDSDNELRNPGFFKSPEKELRRLGVYP